ncbi:MAG: MFS transporter [Acidobacteria bacterium]|nr:MAG: MFS transporter [Acidobacteriota bacterium]
MMQSLIPAIYPILKENFQLDFTQIGLITFVLQLTGALFQPVIGVYTDKHPKAYALATGMGFTLLGMLLLSRAGSFGMVLVATSLVGLGSSIFHPESSRMARAASGGRYGFAQSFFQVGGNFGSALGPVLAAFIVLRHGQSSIAWFSVAALVAMAFLFRVGGWFKSSGAMHASRHAHANPQDRVSQQNIVIAVIILLALLFSKFVYLASLVSYYTFYLISRFGLSVQSAQIHLFVFLAAVAAGTIIGGPVADRVGRRQVILVSILGVLPFTLALPYANLFWTRILTVIIGVVLASAFSVIVVYAQELMPGRVGMIAGLFFGVAFGVSGIGAAVLGALADRTDISYVYRLCSYLPAIGVLAFWLPHVEHLAPHLKEVSPIVPELEPAAE